MRPEQARLVRQWIEKAEEDHTNAEYVSRELASAMERGENSPPGAGA